MIRAPFEQIVGELKSHPFTMLAVVALIVYAAVAVQIYAKAGDVEVVEQKIDRVLRLQLAEAIRSVDRQICATENVVDRRELRNALEDLQEDYATLNAGRRYKVNGCPR